MAVREIKSKAKNDVIRFIKIEMETTIDITVDGDLQDAERYLQRMRTELSRLRDKVRSIGKVPKHFKMVVVSMESKANDTTVIRLKKTTSPNDVTEKVMEAMSGLTLGEQLKS